MANFVTKIPSLCQYRPFLMSFEHHLLSMMLEVTELREFHLSGATSIRIGPLFPITQFFLRPQLE